MSSNHLKEEDNLGFFPAWNYTADVTVKFIIAPGDAIGPTKYVLINSQMQGDNATVAYIQEAIFTRLCNGIGQFQISIVDPTWNTIEPTVIAARGICEIQYGYIEDRTNTYQSPNYKARAYHYELDYDIGRVIIKISGLLSGYNLVTNKDGWVFKKKDITIEEMLEAIADKFDLDIKNGIIEPINNSLPVDFGDIFTSNKTAIRIGNSSGETPLQLITQKLVNHANSIKTGNGGFIFSLSHTNKQGFKVTKPVINFCTPSYKESQDLETGGLRKKVYRIFDAIPDIRILEYRPSWNASLVNASGGAGIVNRFLDKNTGAIKTATAEGTAVKNSTSNQSKQELADQRPQPGLPGSAGAAEANIKNEAGYAAMCPLTAELVILGDPSCEILDSIEVAVRIPNSSQISPTISGGYAIKQIIDRIGYGKYTTHLSLMISPRTLGAEFNGTPTPVADKPTTTSANNLPSLPLAAPPTPVGFHVNSAPPLSQMDKFGLK